ncbi:MAG TPA: SCO family protein [Thermoanaerobaculia bacterium]|nr:SCO family protein [Thermoanaerobaculia bacterium]
MTSIRSSLGAGLVASALALTGATPSALGQALQPAGPGEVKPGSPKEVPASLQGVGFDQRLGEVLPKDLEMVDETGARVALGSLFQGKPMVLVPVYFHCPMLCKLTMQGIARSFADIPFTPGKEYEIVVYSFDPNDRPEVARESKAEALRRYGRPGTDAGWHFLTGDEAAIARLNGAIGFSTRRDEKTGEYAHSAGLVVATPDGKVSRYFFGFDYPAKSLRLTLIEAAAEKIGSFTDHVQLFCFQYDPTTGRYSKATMNLVRLGGALTVIVLALYVTTMLRRERLRTRDSLGTA